MPSQPVPTRPFRLNWLLSADSSPAALLLGSFLGRSTFVSAREGHPASLSLFHWRSTVSLHFPESV